jgi:hypothetical protein
MSINLVSLAQQYLTPDLIAKIASSLGLDRSLIGKAATAAIPALLESFANLASTQDGARKLANAVRQQNPDIMDSLASAIGGMGEQAHVNNGISTLRSLLGGAAVPALADAVGKFTGIDQRPSASLIAMLTPAVLGALGKQQTGQGFDASSLAQLLASQKGNISAALPAGFADLLGAAGLPGFAAVGAQAARTAQSTVSEASRAATPSAFPSWLSWVIPLLVVAAIAWWFLGHRGTEVTEQAKTTAGQPVQSLSVGGIDLGSTLETTFGNLKTTLEGISNATSAQAALPKLQGAASEFDKVGGLSGQLPAAGKAALAALVVAARPSIEDLFNKVLALPGVAPIAKPAIDDLRAKLDALSKT